MKQLFMFDYEELMTIHYYLTRTKDKLQKMRKSQNRDSALFWIDEAIDHLFIENREKEDQQCVT